MSNLKWKIFCLVVLCFLIDSIVDLFCYLRYCWINHNLYVHGKESLDWSHEKIKKYGEKLVCYSTLDEVLSGISFMFLYLFICLVMYVLCIFVGKEWPSNSFPGQIVYMIGLPLICGILAIRPIFYWSTKSYAIGVDEGELTFLDKISFGSKLLGVTWRVFSIMVEIILLFIFVIYGR